MNNVDLGYWTEYRPGADDPRFPLITDNMHFYRNQAGQDWYELVNGADKPSGAMAVLSSDDVVVYVSSNLSGDPSLGRVLLLPDITDAPVNLLGKQFADGAFIDRVAAKKRLPKADLWRRVTDAEAGALDAALAAAPVRLQRIFDAAQYLDTTDPDYPALRAGIEAALGPARADEVLQPVE